MLPQYPSSYSSWATATSSGVSGYYAGGGGGYDGSSGGAGGGGNYDPGNAGANGVVNTGGGGAGSNTSVAGTGGSGIIIWRFSDSLANIASIGGGLTYTQYTTGGYKYYKFTAGTGSVTF